jgi:hypothetical protein
MFREISQATQILLDSPRTLTLKVESRMMATGSWAGWGLGRCWSSNLSQLDRNKYKGSTV